MEKNDLTYSNIYKWIWLKIFRIHYFHTKCCFGHATSPFDRSDVIRYVYIFYVYMHEYYVYACNRHNIELASPRGCISQFDHARFHNPNCMLECKFYIFREIWTRLVNICEFFISVFFFFIIVVVVVMVVFVVNKCK